MRVFVRVWAAEFGPVGIRVSLLAPGITETPLVDRLQSREGGMVHFDTLIRTRTFLGRRGKAEELAAAPAFLCSLESSYITGGAIFVDDEMSEM